MNSANFSCFVSITSFFVLIVVNSTVDTYQKVQNIPLNKPTVALSLATLQITLFCLFNLASFSYY